MTAQEIIDFILGLNVLIMCLAIPYWVIGGILKALFETIEDIIDYIQYMIDSRRFRKHYEETHPDIKAETSNLDNTWFTYYVLVKTLREKTEKSRTPKNGAEENEKRF